eukprot:GHVH01007109.1.p1 GENE.GHVH01007109.1~~GHVH01007109.1.p1  ORF type:complete len:233 (+),score=36.21 GHVH01007109.1:22-720(+)
MDLACFSSAAFLNDKTKKKKKKKKIDLETLKGADEVLLKKNRKAAIRSSKGEAESIVKLIVAIEDGLVKNSTAHMLEIEAESRIIGALVVNHKSMLRHFIFFKLARSIVRKCNELCVAIGYLISQLQPLLKEYRDQLEDYMSEINRSEGEPRVFTVLGHVTIGSIIRNINKICYDGIQLTVKFGHASVGYLDLGHWKLWLLPVLASVSRINRELSLVRKALENLQHQKLMSS